MSKLFKSDRALDELNEERDHVEIQISLLKDGTTPDAQRLEALCLRLKGLERRIHTYRPGQTASR